MMGVNAVPPMPPKLEIDIDASELKQVSAATGGESFTTPDPRKISDVFYQALSKLMCQPPACKN